MNENFMTKLPEFKATKSGYEIRTEILGMAKDMLTMNFMQSGKAGKSLPSVILRQDKSLLR